MMKGDKINKYNKQSKNVTAKEESSTASSKNMVDIYKQMIELADNIPSGCTDDDVINMFNRAGHSVDEFYSVLMDRSQNITTDEERASWSKAVSVACSVRVLQNKFSNTTVRDVIVKMGNEVANDNDAIRWIACAVHNICVDNEAGRNIFTTVSVRDALVKMGNIASRYDACDNIAVAIIAIIRDVTWTANQAKVPSRTSRTSRSKNDVRFKLHP